MSIAKSLIYCYETVYPDIKKSILNKLDNVPLEHSVIIDIFRYYNNQFIFKRDLEKSVTDFNYNELVVIHVLNIYNMVDIEKWETSAIEFLVDNFIISSVDQISSCNLTSNIIQKLYINRNLDEIPTEYQTLDVYTNILKRRPSLLKTLVDRDFYSKLCINLLEDSLENLNFIVSNSLDISVLDYIVNNYTNIKLAKYTNLMTPDMICRAISNNHTLDWKLVNSDVIIKLIETDTTTNVLARKKAYNIYTTNIKPLESTKIVHKFLEYKYWDILKDTDLIEIEHIFAVKDLYTLFSTYENFNIYRDTILKHAIIMIDIDNRFANLIVDNVGTGTFCGNVDLMWAIVKVVPEQYSHFEYFITSEIAYYLIDHNIKIQYDRLNPKILDDVVIYTLNHNLTNIRYLKGIIDTKHLTVDQVTEIMDKTPKHYKYLPFIYKTLENTEKYIKTDFYKAHHIPYTIRCNLGPL
jgi:hypothetical protein